MNHPQEKAGLYDSSMNCILLHCELICNVLSLEVLGHTTLSVNSASKSSKMALLQNIGKKPNSYKNGTIMRLVLCKNQSHDSVVQQSENLHFEHFSSGPTQVGPYVNSA